MPRASQKIAAVCGGGVAPPSYLGLVATKTYVATNGPGALQSQSRTRHRAADTISSLQIVWGNWYVTQTTCVETAGGSTASITASIEYPVGTFTPVKFNGSTGAAVISGSNVVSDTVAVSIPKGAFFFVRMHFSTSGGTISTQTRPASAPFGQIADLANGEAVTYGTSVVDQTMGGTVVDSAGDGTVWTGPLAIIGATRLPSVYILGDSRALGLKDTFVDNSGDTGQIARSIGPYFAYLKGGISGASANAWIAGPTKQVALFGYVSHIIVGLGEVDVVNLARSAAQAYGDLRTVWSKAPIGVKVFQTTQVAESTSTDAWATTVNQNTLPSNANRAALNNLIRSTPPSGGYFEVADVLETSRGSGIWIASPNPPYTPDGVHESAIANLLLKSSGVIDSKRLFR